MAKLIREVKETLVTVTKETNTTVKGTAPKVRKTLVNTAVLSQQFTDALVKRKAGHHLGMMVGDAIVLMRASMRD